jgi:hypothetical protein
MFVQSWEGIERIKKELKKYRIERIKGGKGKFPFPLRVI